MSRYTTDFNTFRDVIRGIETPPDNPFIRTGVRSDAGSAAYGPYQTVRSRNIDILNNKDLDLTDEERRALELVIDRQGLALKYGGNDRGKYEDPNSPEYKSKEFLDRYDYGGDLEITDPSILSAYQSAQEKELQRHFNSYGGDLLEAAYAWHGGDAWRDGSNIETTEDYGRKALSFLDGLNRPLQSSEDQLIADATEQDLGRYSQDYSIQLPDGLIVDVPGGVSLEEADSLAKAQFPESFGIYPEIEPEPKEAGFFSSMYSGLMRAAEELPGGLQAIYGGSSGDDEVFEAAKARVKQADERAVERQGVAVTPDDVSKAYDEEGVISAAAKYLEMTTETIGQSIGYMAPSLVGGFLLGRIGTVAGAMLAGPVGAAAGAGVGTLLGRGLSAISTADKANKLYKAASIGHAVGRTVGFSGTLTTNFLASNLSAAVSAAEERGEELTEEDYNVLEQLAIAGGQSALESIMVLLAGGSIALGTGVKALSRAPVEGVAGLSSAGKRVLMRSVGDAIDYIDNLTPLKRFAATMAEEEVAEVGQQALERLSSGKTVSPLDEEAATEYLQTALISFGPSLFFGGVGGAAAKYQERKEIRAAEAIEQAKADMQAAALRQVKLAEEQEALALEQEAVENRAQFLERVLPVIEEGRTAEDVRIAADSRNINARDIGFSSFVRRITGKSRIEDLNQKEMEKLYRTIESMPVQKVPISFAIASKSDALRLAKSILDSGKKVTTDKVVLDALEDANLLGVDKRYVTEQELSEIAASFRARLNELGLLSTQKGSAGQGVGLKVDTEKYEKLSKLAELAEQNPEVDVVVPQQDYDAVLKYARLENNGYYPDLEAFKRITGFRNDSYYQLALDEAIARGDIAPDGSNRVVQTRTPAARKKAFALEINRGGKVEQLGVYETQKEADAARKAFVDEANEARRIGRGPAGIPELSIKEIGDIVYARLLRRTKTPYGLGRKVEPELVQDYEFDVVERDEYVVRTRDGGIISHHKTAAEARRQIKKIKDKDNADNRERKKNKQPPKPEGERVSSIPTKETVYNVMQSEVGFETGKKTRGRTVVGSDFPGGGFLTREEAEAKAQDLRDRSSGAKSSFGRQATGDQDRETRLGVGLNLSPKDLKELRADPVAFAEKKFPVSERTQGVQQGAETARDNLKSGVDKYLRDRGLSALKVEIVDVIEGDRYAQYDPVNGLFQIAMSSIPEGASVDEQVKAANSLMDHEIVHFALRTGLISRGEFNVLRRAASRTPIKSNIARERGLPTGTTYLQLAQDLYREQGEQEGWIPDDYVEEAIAFMAQDFSRDRKNVTGKPASLFSRVGKAMGSLANVGRGAGFRTSEEIMDTLFGSTFGERYAKDVVKDSYYKNRRHQEEYKQIVNQIFQAAYLDGSLQPRTVYELETTGVISPSMALPLSTTRGTSRASVRNPEVPRYADEIPKPTIEEILEDETLEDVPADIIVDENGNYIAGSIDNFRMFHGSFQDSLKTLRSGTEGGSLGNGIYLTPELRRSMSYGDDVYEVSADIKNPLFIFTDTSRMKDPVVDALVSLGLDREKAIDLVEKDYDEFGYVKNRLRSRARSKGYDSIIQFHDGLLSEIVLFNKDQVTEISNISDQINQTSQLESDLEDIALTPSTGRAALSRSNFRGDPREDNKIDPYDKNKPSLPPYKQPPASRNPKDIIDAVTWGYVNIDQFGKKLGKDRGIRVIIPAGSRDLFGERHIRRHNEDIARNTPYADANEFLAGFFNQLANSPKDLSSGDISYHVDDWGKKLKFIWDSPSFSAPGVVVMEYRDDANDYMVEPRYVVVTGFANEAYSQNTPDGSNATGPRQGIAATTTAVKDFYDNKPNVVPASGRAALNRSAIRNPTEQAAIDAYMGPGGLKQDQKDKSFIKAVFKGMQQYDIPFWEEFRYQIVDKYQGVLSNERAASAKLRASGQLGLTPQEMAATSAHAFMMLKDRAGAFLESMLKYGTIGFTRIQGGDWMDGTVTVNDMQLDNTATNVLMHVPVEGIVRRDVSLPDLYSGTGGLLAILSRIHGKNNSLLNKFFAYGRAVRAYRLNVQEGKPVPDEFLGNAMNDALEFGYKHPEIAVAYANLQKWNESLVNFAVDANVLTREQADIWLRYADYVPFYLDTTGEMTAELREKFRRATKSEDDFKMLNSMLPKPPSKKYKGFKEGTLEDPIQATIRNSMALINESMKNIASHRFLRNMVTTGDARKLDDSKREDRAVKYQAVTVYENGRTVRYYVRDPYLHDIMVGSFDGQGPLESITKAFSLPARLLREGVTRMPDFLLANTTRDAILSWLVHGTTKDPLRATTDSISRIVKDTLAKDGGGTPTQQRLAKAGVVGGLELKDVDLKGIEKRFSRKLAPSSSPSALLTRLWDNLGDVGNFSESAARQRVYERTYDREYKRFMNQGKEGGLTGEALTSYADTHATGQAAFQAMEVLNFSRRGNAPLLRFFTATIPFLNARIQGLDVFYRNARGENTLGIDPDAAKRGFMARSSMVVGATALYAMFMYGDDDFENESEYKRLDNWLIPLGPLANDRNKFLYVPIPFEAGILFKTLPEELVRTAMGESTGEQYRAVQHAITGTLAMNPLPQAIRPAVETWTNYNFFTQQPIVPYFMGKLDQNEQYRDSTSATSRVLSSVIPDFIPFTSPLEIENLMKGYIGSSWNYLTMVTDLVLHRPEFGLNDKTETLLTDRPFFRRFISNGLGRGGAEDYYRMRDEVNGVVATINRLKVKDPSRVLDYARDNLEALRARAFVREADKTLRKIRSARNAILSSGLSPEDKRKRVDQLKKAEISVYRSMPASFGGGGR